MNSLELLAERYGIEKSFKDALGIVQFTAPATRLALLAAMGAEAADEKAAAVALDSLEREEWARALDPVHVAYKTDPLNVPITYPNDTARIRWHLRFESGDERRGEADFAALGLLGQRAIDGHIRERRLLPLPEPIPFGYHQLTLEPGTAVLQLIVTPGQCWLPPQVERGQKIWGVAAQLYLLKSAHNWGIGDFTDLRELAHTLVGEGAEVIGLNPLHAMFPDDPEHASPYSPASRLLLNIINIDVMALVEQCSAAPEILALIQSDEFQRELQASRESNVVDYTQVTKLKLATLRLLFRSLSDVHGSPHWRSFEEFRNKADESFNRSCLFLALREHFSAQSESLADWRHWPTDFRNPDSAAVRQFSKDQQELIRFQMWMQFIADSQLADAARAVQSMAVGLYRDLAVGADASGAETWSSQRSVVTAARVGAPPDIHNPAGQDWGLPPFHPKALKEECYRGFIDLLRANMRHAGGLRIDHVMALQQLYWVPQGLGAAQGAYVRYPLEDLIGILTLESYRNQCLIVGEDLGTVPAGFRERMTAARVFSYRVLFFEQEKAGFIAPDQYPFLSLAVAGSHDLPTLSAWIDGSDLELKQKLKLFPTEKHLTEAKQSRYDDRQRLLLAFKKLGISVPSELSTDQFADAAHAFLARSASAITMVQLDDITQESAPVNVPTTSSEHPNWRRKLSKSIEEIAAFPGFHKLARILNRLRSQV
jgi:4-alpha-glucanotransferase